MDSWAEIEVGGVPLLVSREGEVRTVDRETPYRRKGRGHVYMMKFKGRTIRPCLAKTGYLEVATCHKGRKVSKFLVHRLVAMAFVPGFAEGLVVNHKNGDKLDNRPGNLEWVTKGENSKHAWASGLIPLRGEGQPTAKLSERQVSYIRRLLADGVSVKAIAVIAGVSTSLIYNINSGKAWAHVVAA